MADHSNRTQYTLLMLGASLCLYLGLLQTTGASATVAQPIPVAPAALSATFHLVNHQPLTHAVDVTVTASISGLFDAEVNTTTVSNQTWAVHSGFGGLLTGTYTVAGSAVTFDPARPYFAGEQVQVIATGGIQGTGGESLVPQQWSFMAGSVHERDEVCFINIGAGLAALKGSSVAWGDYDNDGDLDILLSGSSDGNSLVGVSKVYRNDGGSFSDINASLPGVYSGSVAWGDYDNDSDLDILLSGIASNGYVSEVYRNDGGNFSDINAGLTSVAYSSVAWGDYDNDGDLDILLSGWVSDDPPVGLSKVYRNDDGNFSDINAGLIDVGLSSVAWGDYDNDGDLDILLTGLDNNEHMMAKIYRNDGGSFTAINAGLTSVAYSSVAWGDYDNDSDLDILLSGIASNGYESEVYRNDGGSFTAINAGLTSVASSSVAWGDYDNDGDLDILLSGSTTNNPSGQGFSKVYRNDGGTFVDINAGLLHVSFSSIAWGDYDNDGDLDILLSGLIAGHIFSAAASQVYRNVDCADLSRLFLPFVSR